jgi:hypothetical protein
MHLDTPRVELRKDEQLLVFVTHTNPLIFSAGQTAAILTDSPDAAKLKVLLDGLASVMVATIRSSAARTTPVEPLPPLPTGTVTETVVLNASPGEKPDLRSIANRLVENLDEESDTLTNAIADLHDASATTVDLVQRIADNEAAMYAFASRVESGGPAWPLLPDTGKGKPELNRDLPLAVDGALREFATRQQDLRMMTPSCQAKIAAAERAITSWLDGPATDGTADAKARAFRADAKAVTKIDPGCKSTFAWELTQLGEWLLEHPPVKAAKRKIARVHALETALFALADYENAVTDRAAALAAAEKVGPRRIDILNSAGAYRTMLFRQQRHYTGSDCSLIEGVIEVQRNVRTEVDQPFDKNGSESFSVTLQPEFANVSTVHPKTLTATYEVVARRNFDIDVDFAPVLTPLKEPTFGVVTRIVDELGPGGAPVKIEKKLIGRTKEQARAGQIAVFATVKSWRLTQFRPQFGASVSTDAPGLFGGIAYVPSRYFKVSGGWTMQKVTGLAKGLHEGQPITDASELQTRDIFDNDWYVAVSITIDNLPLFRKP